MYCDEKCDVYNTAGAKGYGDDGWWLVAGGPDEPFKIDLEEPHR